MDSTNNCVICFEHLSQKTIGAFHPCGHWIHEDCFHRLEQTNTCPLCNVEDDVVFSRIYLDLSELKQVGDDDFWKEKHDELEASFSTMAKGLEDTHRKLEETEAELEESEADLEDARLEIEQNDIIWRKKCDKLRCALLTTKRDCAREVEKLSDKLSDVESVQRFEKVNWKKKYKCAIEQRDDQIQELQNKLAQVRYKLERKKEALSESQRQVAWLISNRNQEVQRLKRQLRESNAAREALAEANRAKDVALKTRRRQLRAL